MKLLNLHIKYYMLIVVFSILITGCGKDDNAIVNPPPPTGNELKIKDNVKTIDTSAILQSDSTQISQGIYIFQYQSTPPTISDNSIIVGIQGEGFLRKVTGNSISGNNLTLNSTDATMEDIFESGSFNFNIDFSRLGNDDLHNKITPQRDSKLNGFNSKVKKKDEKNLNQKESNNFEERSSLQSVSSPIEIKPGLYLENQEIIYHTDGIKMNSLWDFDFSNTTIYSNGILSITIPNGTASFKPNFEYGFEWGLTGIKKLKCLFNNAEFNTNFDVQFTASQPIQLLDEEKVLLTYRLHFIFWTPSVIPIPIRMITELKLVAKYNADLKSSITYKIGETNSNILSMGLNYDNGSWADIYVNNNSAMGLHKDTLKGAINFSQSLKIIPKVSVKFYGIAGPYIAPYYYENFNSEIGSPNLDWQVNLTGGVAADVGAAVTIFGRTLANYSKHFEGPFASWIVPSNVTVNSGNNQQGQPNQQLSQPVKVIVKDNFGVGHPNVPVYFNVTGGGGSVSNSQVITDDAGIAEINWTLGPNPGANTLTSVVRKPNGTVLNSVSFNANASIQDSTRIFVGTYENGVFMSQNNGASWSAVNNGLPTPSYVLAIAIKGNDIFAGTDFSGLYMSENNGASWSVVNNGLPFSSTVHAIAIKGNDIFVSTYIRGTYFAGLYLSQNNGASWSAVNNGIEDSTFVFDFAINGNDIFAASSIGVYLSQNNGASWSLLNNGLSTSEDYVRSLAIKGNDIFAGTYHGVYLSQNNGANWSLVNNGLPALPYVFDIAINGNNVFLGSQSSGVYLSQNNGASWSLVNNGLPTPTFVNSLAINGNDIFACGYLQGVFLSQNNGGSWTAINNGLSGENLTAIAIKNSYSLAGN